MLSRFCRSFWGLICYVTSMVLIGSFVNHDNKGVEMLGIFLRLASLRFSRAALEDAHEFFLLSTMRD